MESKPIQQIDERGNKLDTVTSANPSWLRERVATLLKSGYSPSRIRIETGHHSLDINAWMELGESPEHDPAFAEWLDRIETDSKKSEPEFVLTPTARSILAALEAARVRPTIALIYGPAGVGKTQTAQHYAAQSSFLDGGRVYYVMCSKTRRNVTGALEQVAEALGAVAHSYRSKQLEDAICSRLYPGDLLIIDEAQHLRPDALDALRYFYDARGVGIAYLGNERVYRDIHDPGKAGKFAQLDSRVGKRLHLTVPSEDDIDAILEGWKVRGIQERKFSVDMGARDGGLRSLSRVLRIAWAIACARGEQFISIDDLLAAAQETGDIEAVI